jgi:hypothetical protein
LPDQKIARSLAPPDPPGVFGGAASIVTGCGARGSKNGVVAGLGATVSGCNALATAATGSGELNLPHPSNNSSNNSLAGTTLPVLPAAAQTNHSDNFSFGILVMARQFDYPQHHNWKRLLHRANNKVVLSSANSPAFPAVPPPGRHGDPWANFNY